MPDELRAEKSFPSKPYNSLKNKSEFDRVYRKGFKKHNPFFRSLFWIYQKSHQKKKRALKIRSLAGLKTEIRFVC